MNYTISVVSHYSGKHLQYLLKDLQSFAPNNSEIILTINVPEDETYLEAAGALPLKVVRNLRPYGFGENHNRAFQNAKGRYFIVVNPDIRLITAPFEVLSSSFTERKIGACAPIVFSPQGQIQDSVRRFPTFFRLLKRRFQSHHLPDYDLVGGGVQDIDWAAGMFVMFDADAFREIGGFDARYFMYLEDVDICRRLWAHNYRVCAVPEAQVIHDAQRASRRSFRHLSWHIRSTLRFFVNI